MPTQNVNLSDQQAQFIRKSVNGGSFRNASEVVRAGLRLLEREKKVEDLKLQRLRKLFKEANDQIDRGEYVEVTADNIDEFMESLTPRERSRKQR